MIEYKVISITQLFDIPDDDWGLWVDEHMPDDETACQMIGERLNQLGRQNWKLVQIIDQSSIRPLFFFSREHAIVVRSAEQMDHNCTSPLPPTSPIADMSYPQTVSPPVIVRSVDQKDVPPLPSNELGPLDVVNEGLSTLTSGGYFDKTPSLFSRIGIW